MPKKPKSSVFIGVHKQQRGDRWLARCVPARFSKVCHSEMEAAAHYTAVAKDTAVAKETWPDEKSLERLAETHNPWRGRPCPPRGWDRDGKRVIDIDHKHYALVDDCSPFTGLISATMPYLLFKDEQWFVQDGHAWMITTCGYDEDFEGWWFQYASMQELIFGGPCIHLNRCRLDNRIENLIPPELTHLATGTIKPSISERFARHRARLNDPLRRQFDAAMKEWLRWQDWEKNKRGGVWYGEQPSDPRKAEKFHRFRVLPENEIFEPDYGQS
jgi:hypothetical protein